MDIMSRLTPSFLPSSAAMGNLLGRRAGGEGVGGSAGACRYMLSVALTLLDTAFSSVERLPAAAPGDPFGSRGRLRHGGGGLT